MTCYAVKKDKTGFRSIDTPDDLLPDEYFSDEMVELVQSDEDKIRDFRADIQRHLDEAAVLAGYDDIKTAVTYAEEPAVPKFQAEGQALRAWRSLVWSHGYDLMDKVLSGDVDQPSRDELIDGLPKLVMP